MPSDPEDSTENPLADSPPKDEDEDFEPEPEPDPEQVTEEVEGEEDEDEEQEEQGGVEEKKSKFFVHVIFLIVFSLISTKSLRSGSGLFFFDLLNLSIKLLSIS